MVYEGIYDGENFDATIYKKQEDIINKVNQLALSIQYIINADALREKYTDILISDDVESLILELSKEQCFIRDFPEFYVKNKYGENVINCPQNSNYHKYGVFKHILVSIQSVGKNNITFTKNEIMIMKWTMLLHDIGKPYVKFHTDEGKESFKGHDDKSVELAGPILERFNFSPRDAKVILTLIKYHDKFLNEGEITYDNLRLLAEELENKRNLFKMLIEVKEADASSKSIEVYNKYKITKQKYIDFASSYFDNIEYEMQDKNLVTDALKEEFIRISNTSVNGIQGEKKSNTNKENNYIPSITSFEYDNIIENIINKKLITTVYQPIIDIIKKCVFAYETFTKIEYSKEIKTDMLLKYAEENDKYDKINQSMLLNNIYNFKKEDRRESNYAFFNMDLNSYQHYANKPRIYDEMMALNFVLELHNYDKYSSSELNEKIKKITENNGKVCLDNFGANRYTSDDLLSIKAQYLKIDRSIIKGINESEEKQKYVNEVITACIVPGIEVIAIGVETEKEYLVLKKIGVRYMQGKYFTNVTPSILCINNEIPEKLNNKSIESIV